MNKLWLIAIGIRFIAILIALRKAPLSWLAWACFVEATDLILYAMNMRHSGWYQRVWIVQQIGSAALLVVVIYETIIPPESLIVATSLVTGVLGVFLCTTRVFPNSPIEPTLILCGLSVLAMGIMAAVIGVATFRVDRYVLATYLILSAFLMLAAPDYLQHVGLGRAWELLEVIAFSVWGGYYLANSLPRF